MGAPLDWSAAGGIEAVKMLCREIGQRPAARRLGLSDSHSAALRQIISREQRAHAAAVTAAVASVTAPIVPVTVPSVVHVTASPQEAVDAEKRDKAGRATLATIRHSCAVLEQAAAAPRLEESPLVVSAGKALVQARAPGWEEQQQPAGGPVLVNLDLRGMLDAVAPQGD